MKITINDYNFNFLFINLIDLNNNWDLGYNFFSMLKCLIFLIKEDENLGVILTFCFIKIFNFS